MAGPTFTAANFTAALKALLPRGYAWPRDPDSVMAKVMSALAPTFSRQSDASVGLINDSPAFQLDQMLPEWELTLGLPDPCGGPSQSLEQRVAQVILKLTALGGQSADYFLAIANRLGFTNCTITTYAPFRCGRSDCGDMLGGPGWLSTWLLTAPDVPVTYFRCGVSACGDPLYTLGGDTLRCTVDEFAPAHTTVLYAGQA